ncbi:MAG: hypothetical protein RIS70_3522 [Planctomycetota bacterium]
MSGKHYTPAEHALIEKLARQGLGATAIARELRGRSAGGVQGQLVKMGFINPVRSAIARSRKSREMNPSQHRRFRDFLRENIAIAPPIELMRHWNEQAPRHGLPRVSIDMVDYWIDKMRIRLTPEEAAANPHYREARKLRYAKRSETAKATIEVKAQKRYERMKERRREVLARKTKPERRTCPACGEAWPLTAEFFRAKTDRRNGRIYYEAKGCIACVNANRRRISQLRAGGYDADAIRRILKSEQRQRRDAKAARAVRRARDQRAAVLRAHTSCPQKTCIDCGERWPLRDDFWKRAANGSFPRFCRYCDSRYRREQKRARVDGRAINPIRDARRTLLDQAHRETRLARRAEFQDEAKKLKRRGGSSVLRQCPVCNSHWPLDGKFWLYEPGHSPRAGKLARRYCRCCSHDKDADRNRRRKW